jgi:hypothetical protein
MKITETDLILKSHQRVQYINSLKSLLKINQKKYNDTENELKTKLIELKNEIESIELSLHCENKELKKIIHSISKYDELPDTDNDD